MGEEDVCPIIGQFGKEESNKGGQYDGATTGKEVPLTSMKVVSGNLATMLPQPVLLLTTEYGRPPIAATPL